MSKYDYDKSKQLAGSDIPFYALIMAAMRQADGANSELLKTAWPGVWDEMVKRYNAPGGFLAGEKP